MFTVVVCLELAIPFCTTRVQYQLRCITGAMCLNRDFDFSLLQQGRPTQTLQLPNCDDSRADFSIDFFKKKKNSARKNPKHYNISNSVVRVWDSGVLFPT